MTDRSGLATLAATLDVPTSELAMLETYDDAQLHHLDALVSRSMAAEEQAFDESLEHALTFVPRLLRGAARSMVFPGGGK